MFLKPGEVKSTISSWRIGLATVIENRDIDDNLVSRCYHIWSELGRVGAKIDKFIQNDKRASHEAICQFGNVVRNYRELFRKQLEKAVKTRSRDKEVEKIINTAESHRLFQSSQLERWLDWKQEESEIADKVDQIKGDVVFLKKRQLKQKLANSAGKRALVLNIPQLGQETDKILSSMKVNEDTFNSKSMPASVGSPWYTNQEKRKLVLDRIRELAEHMDNNKHLEDRVKFFLTSPESIEDFSCYYSIYEADKLAKDKIDRLPISPIGLKFRFTETSSVCISWDHEKFTYPYKFSLERRSKVNAEKPWTRETTDKPNIRFKPGQEMEVRVAMETLIGRSKFSDVLIVPAVVKQLPPKVKSVTESTAQLEWIPPSVGGKFSYRLQYLSSSPGSYVQELVVGNKTCCLVTNLFPETTYNVNIVVETEDGQQNILSSEILQFTTSKAREIRFAETVLTSCKKIDIWNNLDIYAVPVTKTTQPDSRVDRFVFGIPGGRKQHKTILLLGAAGSGKTALINSLVNYILNVDWADPFRFQLIDGHLTKGGTHQIDTKTTKISIYDIHHAEGFNIPYSLTIVDTPGYEVTNYRENAEEIAQTIRQLIENQNGIKELDMICYVLNSSPSYSMAKEVPIFDSVLSMFGKDVVRDNINLVLTFAVGRVPEAVDGFTYRLSKKKICNKPLIHQSFNNFDMFSSNDKEPSRSFWNATTENFKNFFDELNRKQPRLLSSTLQILEEKKDLEETVDSLSKLINIILIRKNAIKESKAVVSRCRLQIEDYKNDPAMRKFRSPTPSGFLARNCRFCSVTCEILNTRSFASQVTYPFCDICPGKCELGVHSSDQYMIESNEEADLKFAAEIQEMQTAKGSITVLQREVEEYEMKILERVDTFLEGIERLEGISCPKPYISVEFIDMIIKILEQKLGFQQKIEKFFNLRKNSSLVLRF